MKLDLSIIVPGLWAAMMHMAMAQSQTTVTDFLWFPKATPHAIQPSITLSNMFSATGSGLSGPQTTAVTLKMDSKGVRQDDLPQFMDGLKMTYYTTSVLAMTFVQETVSGSVNFGTVNLSQTTVTNTRLGTLLRPFLTAECTSTSGATTASCSGKYGTISEIITRIQYVVHNGSQTRVEFRTLGSTTISSATPYPTNPPITTVLATVATRTASSSTGGVPRQTGSEFLAGAAVAVAGVAAMLL